MNARLDKRKSHLIPLDDKAAEHQRINSPPNEFTENILPFDEPPKKTISNGIEDSLEVPLDDETLRLITTGIETRV